MRKLGLCGLLLALLLMALPLMADDTSTIGGIFVKNLKVTNNGKVVLSDGFDKEELQGWSPVNSGGWSVNAPGETDKLCLYLNREIDENTGISRKLDIKKVGAIEISACVYLPAPDQQWAYTHGASCRTRIDFEMPRGNHSFYIPIDLNPDENGYRIGLVWFKPELREAGKDVETYQSPGVAITPEKWALVSLKLDPKTSMATLSVDGKEQVSCSYSPDKVQSVDYFDVTTWMGNERRGGEQVESTRSVKIRPRYVPQKRGPSG